MTYDLDGNMLSDGTKAFSYNAENQLKSVTVPGVSVSTYDYDYMGRRIGKSVDVLDGSGLEYSVTWVYDGWNAVQGSKSVGGGTATVKNFVWGLDLSQSMQGAGGIGGLVAVVDESGSANLFAYDGNGNVSELVAANGGSVGAHYEYDAFGNVTLASGSLAGENCYRFSTKERDDETGLVYYGYRFYDGGNGRWTQRDPAEEDGGINLHAMVANNTVNHFDILGRMIEADHVARDMDEVKAELRAIIDRITGNVESSTLVDVERLNRRCCLKKVEFLDSINRQNALYDYLIAMHARYLWTNQGGWVDLLHLFGAAFLADKWYVPGFYAVAFGKTNEENQSLDPRWAVRTGFSAEDLPSNTFGINFEAYSLDADEPCLIPEQLEKFVNETLGGAGAPPTSDIPAFNRVRNFSDEPVLSPTGHDVGTDPTTRILYKGAGDAAYERKWLDILYKNGVR